jgi:hypothetical protein
MEQIRLDNYHDVRRHEHLYRDNLRLTSVVIAVLRSLEPKHQRC